MCLGLANGGYVPPKEEKMSLSKFVYGFNRIKDMSVDELALNFATVSGIPSFCDLCEKKWGDHCAGENENFNCDINYRKSLMKQWLESEAE